MKPFLHNEVFRPNDNPTVHFGSVGNTKAIVADYFFDDISAVRKVVKDSPAGNWKYKEDGRNFKDYYDCRISFPAMQSLMFQKSQELIKEHFEFLRITQRISLSDALNKDILAQGELMSTKLFSLYLEQENIEHVLIPALDFMCLDANDEPDLSAIEEKINIVLANHPSKKLFITIS